MTVGVLGPLAVDGDGDSLAPRDRVVLAALAMSPREAVRPERLADALWGDEPPATWSKVVQGSVVRIRKVLGAEAVRTTRQGYVLDVPEDTIDAFRFEGLVRRARELLALNEPERAGYQVTQALDLWYGGALADLDGWAPGEAAAKRWEELRHDAEELRVEAALRSGAWREVLPEAGRLVSEEPFREARWALLARAQYQGGRQGEALSTLQRARAVLAGELGLDPGPELAALEQAILHQDPDLLPGPDAHASSMACPYRGLLCYDVDDAERFFGREAELAACREILARQHVLAVVGPSGSGKSSLVRAGVAASLRAEGRSLAVVSPGPHPLTALEAARGLGPRGVLVVDQLEETVTLCADAAEREAFLDALVDHHAAGVQLVLALRADRLGHVSAHRRFARLLERGLHLLGAMDDDDLRSAVEGPARQAGLLLEPGLVDLLVQEVSGEPGALPLLSHALAQTWERREGRSLTVEGYRSSDGIRGAVAQTAERVFLALGPEQQQAARDLMLRLVVPGEAGEPARSPLPRRIAAPDSAHEEVIELLVAARLVTSDDGVVSLAHESLARAWPRLRGWLDADTEGQLMLRHLTLAADSWETMGRPDSELYRGPRLARALEWREGGTTQLTDTESAFLDAADALAQAESRSAEQRLREQAASNRRLRGLLGGVAALLLVALVAGALAVREGGRADDQARRADDEARLAQVRELAAASRAVRTDDPELAVLLAREATSPSLNEGDEPPRAAVEALHEAVAASRIVYSVEGQIGGSVAWSRSGDLIATEGPSSLVDIRDAATGESAASFEGHDAYDGIVWNVAFGPGDLLATGARDGLVRVWDPDDRSRVAEVTGEGDVLGTTFAAGPSTRFAAAWPDEGVVRVGSVRGRSVVGEFAVPGTPEAVSLSPDGSSLAIATRDPGAARSVDVRTGRTEHALAGHSALVTDVAHSPDGRWLATASNDGTVRVRDARTGRTRHLLTEADTAVLALAWSPDSRRLATGGWDGRIRVYDVGPRGAGASLTLGGVSIAGGVGGLAFSPDGTRVLAGNTAVTAIAVWDVGPTADAEVMSVTGADATGAGVAFGPDGRLYTAGASGSVAVWDGEATSPDRRFVPRQRDAGRPPADSVAVSPDGRTVATGDSPSGGTVWDGESGDRLFATAPGKRTWRPAFSPDGRLVAVAGGASLTVRSRDGGVVNRLPGAGGAGFRDPVFSPDGRSVVAMRATPDDGRLLGIDAMRWRWRDGRREAIDSWTWTGPGARPALSPDGTRLAVANPLEPTRVYDVASETPAFELEGAAAGAADLAWSPDGSLLATAGLDGTPIVWDARDGTPLLRLPRADEEVSRVAFSPDGRHLATASVAEDVTRVWTLDVAELRDIAETKVVRDLTDAECREYLHRGCDGD